ncbi:hypothetical protein XENTR_v10016768 [Xenopus tropicalis]|nr:hypothetical protein XENTR_v10016768 [Xenopus tropicalis]
MGMEVAVLSLLVEVVPWSEKNSRGALALAGEFCVEGWIFFYCEFVLIYGINRLGPVFGVVLQDYIILVSEWRLWVLVG